MYTESLQSERYCRTSRRYILSMYRDEFQRKSAAAVLYWFSSKFSAQIYLDNYYYYIGVRICEIEIRNYPDGEIMRGARIFIQSVPSSLSYFLKIDSWRKLKLNIYKLIKY